MTEPGAQTERPHPAPLRGVWERIKAHKVVQWTLAYLALAYTLLHGAEMLGSTLGWSHGVLRLFTLLLILGIPVAVVLAWYHGARGERRVSGTELMIIAILLALGGTLLWRDSRTPHELEDAAVGNRHAGPVAEAPQPAPVASIAVLAFSDLSAEGNQAYFSDGVAEEILNVLAHVKGLKVASRTSSFQFRKSDLGAPAIAQKLGVRHILEGSVRKAGDTVRISAQLIDAATDQHLWSETFDRPLTTANLFGIQDEIARAIVEQLTATFGSTGGVGRPAPVKAGTDQVDVYDLYLKGRALFVARSQENLGGAARTLRKALAKDTNFARAWEMLAAVLLVSEYWGLREEPDYQQAALDAADRALRLDSSLSLAYTVRGAAQANMVFHSPRSNWQETFASFAESIARDGQNATAFLWRGGTYENLGFLQRAAQDYQQCLAIDPAYEICRRFLARAHLALGHRDEALRLYEIGLMQGYTNDAAQFAPAVAARGDRLGALGLLIQQYSSEHSSMEAPRLRRLIQPLFRALTDPAFSEADRKEALALLAGVNSEQDDVITALWMLGAFEEMTGIKTDNYSVLWANEIPAWIKSPARKNMMRRLRLPEYWRAYGFPPQCRPLGGDDFECH